VAGESNLNQLEWHTRDIVFVLDELERANRVASSALPFAGRLDLSRVGVFGHSFGGMAAAHACQINRRIKACLNQDGAIAMQPFHLDTRGWGMDQPFMLIERAPETTPPSDQALAAMKLTRQRADELLARLRHEHDVALRSTGRGSYRVVLDRTKTTHMDFSDLPFLGARSPSEADTRARILAVVRSWTLAFFDETLRGQTGRVLASKSPREFTENVQRFPPAKKPW
jgi:pimeloyl-ACP methyl ester carboxylesterase